MRELERLLRGRRFPPPADAETASAPLARLGPGVVVYPEVVVIDGARFPRRQYRREPPLDPLPVRRPLDPTWESQLDHLSPPAALEAAIPDEGEIFTYISPTMARILRRIATVDSAHGFVLLGGPTGCGKTTLAKTYCWLTRQPLTELTFSGDTTLTDFYRSVEVVRDAQGRQSTVTVPGPAVEAMLRGKKLLINEINMLPPDILTVFTQAMDTGRLILSGTQRGNIEINVHRDFGIIGTANPHYIGTLDIGRAMERRFGRGLGYIEMTFLPPEEEAAAVANEFSRLALFARHNLTAPQDLCLRLATLAARLRSDPQIGPVIQSRLSTRSLVHWLGLAQITGLPLREIAAQALLTTVPRDAREKALALIQETLGAQRLEPVPALTVGALPPETLDGRLLDPTTLPRRSQGRRPGHGDGVVVHRVRYQKHLPDGTRVLIGEPFYPDDGRRVGLGLKIRAYDPSGRQITDPRRLETIAATLRDEYGLNVPWRTGHLPQPHEILPCLTRTTWQALRLLEAAILLGRPVFIAGPTGCGKSSLARTLAYLKGKRVVEFSFTGETAKGDLTASRRLVGGVTRWTTQAFLEALARGDCVIVNEYNVAYPDVHSLINSLFDKGAKLTLPDGRVFRLHPDAWLIATGFLEGPGVKPLNEAVENRFGAIIALDYPPLDEELAVLRHVAPHLATAPALESALRFIDYCRRLAAGRVDPATLVGLSRAAQEALRQAARHAALSTAELVALARSAQTPTDFAQRLRTGVLEGLSEAGRRVLEPVLLQYELVGS